MTSREVRSLFDQNRDSRLDKQERARARTFLSNERSGRRFPGPQGGHEGPPPKAGKTIQPEEIQATPKTQALYDEKVLRTVFLDFEDADWEAELADFWKTDIDVPAVLTMDGQTMDQVGVRFRGSSSFFTVPKGKKRSLNIAIDYGEGKERLHGYKTINLLNSHTDPSFVRTLLFNHIARNYIPAERSNYLRLVINRENWGIYINTQQFNKDFLDEWFGTKKGIRWKMLPNPRGGKGLGYDGDHPIDYEGRYVMKSKGGDAEWQQLIKVFKTLNETPPSDLEEALNPIFNIDRALWFLALENVFIDNDGYWTRASDFTMYTDPKGRLHMIPHDSNETFQRQGGRGTGGSSGVNLDPLYGVDNPEKPLIHRLLQVPRLRARYLAHVRTLKDEWLSWDKIGPIAKAYHTLIDEEIRIDTRKHDSYEAFQESLTEETETAGFRGRTKRISIQDFVEQRRSYLDQHPELTKPAPVFRSVRCSGANQDVIYPGEPIRIVAQFEPSPSPDSVSLFYSGKKHSVYREVQMEQKEGTVFEGSIPAQNAGEKLFFYVAAQIHEANTVAFAPSAAEFKPSSIRVSPPIANDSYLFINEVMASNTKTLADETGKFEDWVELVNTHPEPIDLTGYYLSDNPKNPLKWTFPEGTIIPANGHLIVWADEDHKSAEAGLHTNFKLSKQGETLTLYDRDERRNRQIDQISFENLSDDESWGRQANNRTDFRLLTPSPGKPNH